MRPKIPPSTNHAQYLAFVTVALLVMAMGIAKPSRRLEKTSPALDAIPSPSSFFPTDSIVALYYHPSNAGDIAARATKALRNTVGNLHNVKYSTRITDYYYDFTPEERARWEEILDASSSTNTLESTEAFMKELVTTHPGFRHYVLPIRFRASSLPRFTSSDIPRCFFLCDSPRRADSSRNDHDEDKRMRQAYQSRCEELFYPPDPTSENHASTREKAVEADDRDPTYDLLLREREGGTTDDTASSKTTSPPRAFVTILTTSDVDYAMSALALGRSLAFFDSTKKYDRVLMVTNAVSPLLTSLLARDGWRLRRVEAVEESWFAHPKCRYRPVRKSQNARWGLMATKLRVWEMEEEYPGGIIYLDTDVVVTGRIWEMFRAMERTGAALVGEGGTLHRLVNAGVMALRPSRAKFTEMLEIFRSEAPPRLFGNLIDCTEVGVRRWTTNGETKETDRFNVSNQMALINRVFGTPRSLPTSIESNDRGTISYVLSTNPEDKASIGRPDVQRDYAGGYSPWAVHFLRVDLCPKPWRIPCGSLVETKRALGGRRCDLHPYRVWCGFVYGFHATRDDYDEIVKGLKALDGEFQKVSD